MSVLSTFTAHVWAPLVAWWRGPIAVPELSAVADRYAEDVAPVAPAADRQTQHVPDDSTRWHLRGQILERIDEYFDCMRQLRRHDRTSYDLFAKTGFAIPSDLYCQGMHGTARPSFGGFLMSATDHKHGVLPSFVYFQKMQHTIGVQSCPGWDVYRVTALYDSRVPLRGGRRICAPLVLHVAVHPDGDMRLLLEQTTERHNIQTTRRNGVKRGRVVVASRRWTYPAMVFDICADVVDGATMKNTPQSFACFLLSMAIGTYSDATEKIVVRATNGDVTAAFGISIDRAKYFFADREVDALAADGRRKRIFHAVIRHTRKIASDRTTEVRAHYRGLRSFTWNGHHVSIVLPSHSKVMRAELAGAVDMESIDDAQRDQYVSMGHLGAHIAEVLAR